jgi:hypothetical protein
LPNVPAGSRITGTMLSLYQNFADIGTVTVTAATLTDLTGTFTIPGGDALVGNMYEIEAWGNGVWGSTQQALTLQGALGNQLVQSVQLGANLWNASLAFRWRLSFKVICLSLGTTGTFQSILSGEASVFGTTLLSGNTANNSIGFVECDSSGSYTVDTTADQAMKIQASWASTTGAPTISKRIAFQRKMGVG